MLEKRKHAEGLFEILADSNRRTIMEFLRIRPRSVGELVGLLKLSQPGVSKHLRILKDVGLVTAVQHSQKRIYHLRPFPLEELDHWLEPYRQYWTNKLDALEQFLDEEE